MCVPSGDVLLLNAAKGTGMHEEVERICLYCGRGFKASLD